MSNRMRQNRYYLFENRTKSAVLGLVLLMSICLASSLFNGGASPARAQTQAGSPPFQLEIMQKYYHPIYTKLYLFIDNRVLMYSGLPSPWDGLPQRIDFPDLPENKWVQLETPPYRGVSEKLPIAVMKGSCNVMVGCQVMAQWLP